MKKQRRSDLSIRLQPDGRVLVSSQGTGIGATVPAIAIGILAFCSEPRARADVLGSFGPHAGQLFDGLVEVELLVEPSLARATPAFFDNFASLDIHRRMLSDEARVEAYRHAIEALVGPGKVALDAGTGSGVLASFAALAGADHVYAVDNAAILDHARVVFSDSGLDGQVTAVRGDFATVALPRQVDVVITETFGILALAEGAAADLATCCDRNLAPDGVVCPSEVRLFFAPVTDIALRDGVLGPFDCWDGVDFSSLRSAQLQRGITMEVPDDAVFGKGACLASLPFPYGAVEAHGEVSFPGTAGVRFAGLVGWFDLQLAPGHVLSTGPAAPMTHWQQCFLPMEIGELDQDFHAHIHVVPAPEDRRSLEVVVDWDAGEQRGSLRYRLR